MTSKSRRSLLEWAKSLCILLLLLSTFSLLRQSTLYEGLGFLTGERREQSAGRQPTANPGQGILVKPMRMAMQNAQGRQVLQYDQAAVDALFESKLGALLLEALASATSMQPSTAEAFQAALGGSGSWIYYDFMSNLPLSTLPLWLGNATSNEALAGAARSFVLLQSTAGYGLYCHNDHAQSYLYSALSVEEGARLEAAIADITPGGLHFAFEAPEQYGQMGEYLMIEDSAPRLPRLEVSNPLANLDDSMQESVLRALAFNPSAAQSYSTVDGQAVREGLDSLRINKDGTVLFEAQGGDARYPVVQESATQTIAAVQRLLISLMGERCGSARPYFVSLESRADGGLLLRFDYLVNGVVVKRADGENAASFTVRDGAVVEFKIHLRSYLALEEQHEALPEVQAASAVRSLSSAGKVQLPGQLQLAYLDTLNKASLLPDWILG